MDGKEEKMEQVRSHQGILEAALSTIFPTRDILSYIFKNTHLLKYSLICIFTRDKECEEEGFNKESTHWMVS